ncbi:hypothetical protein scyTo_0005270, partial [Scyliorhinus torazame]|nr:hypothetical protein [Scyliorhinus torazame]
MLFWHTQPEHFHHRQHHTATNYLRDALTFPVFKHDESNLPSGNGAKLLPFQYVLCTATSPAVKLHEETLTYLNQGQSYEICMFDNREPGDGQEIIDKYIKSIIRVVFHDRRLQYMEHQQLEGWRWSRPGDRILDMGSLYHCQIKVFKPKGADRKQKTEREKIEKRTVQEREKYQHSCDTTILTQMLAD